MNIKDHDGVLEIELVEGARWRYSRFPDPLITVDFGHTPGGIETVVGVTFVGVRAQELKEALR